MLSYFILRVTLDTNVVYQALRSNSGASHAILKMIRNSQLEMAISIPVFNEYADVLNRKKSLEDLNLTKKDISSFLDFVCLVSFPYDISFLLRPNLKDENDNMFVELAFASNSKFLITSNISDFTKETNLLFDSFQIMTPAQFLTFWRKHYE